MKVLYYLSIFVLGLGCVSSAAALNSGETVAQFSATDYRGEVLSFGDIDEEVVVLEWFNQGCPYVKKHYDSRHMQELQNEYAKKGVKWLVINSTSKDHKDYLSPEKTAEMLKDWNIDAVRVLLDPDGSLGKLFGAKTTPHIFVVNKGVLVYQGAIDDNGDAFSDPKESKNYLRETLNEVLAGKQVSKSETKPYGCSVKYAE